MNRKVKYISGLLIVIVLLLAPIFMKHWADVDWLMLGKVFGLFLLFYMIYRVTLYYRYKRIEALIQANEFEEALFRVKSLFRLNLFPNQTDQRLCLRVAILCLKHDDRKNFLRYINKLEHPVIESHKYFWKAILHIREGSLDKARMNEERFKQALKHDKDVTLDKQLGKLLDRLMDYPVTTDVITMEVKRILDPLAIDVLNETIAMIHEHQHQKVETNDKIE